MKERKKTDSLKADSMNGFRIVKEHVTESGQKYLKIKMEGDLYLQNSHAIWQQLLKSVEECEQLVIQIGNVTDFDLSAIQMLVAIEKDISSKGHKVEWIVDLPYEIKSLLENAGMDVFLNRKNVK